MCRKAWISAWLAASIAGLVSAQEIAVDWAYGTPGQGVGRVRASRDLSPAEIYIPAAYSPDWFWQAWSFDQKTLEARTTFLSAQPWSTLRRVDVGDVFGDGGAEVVAAYSNGTVRIHDEITRTLVSSFQAPLNPYVRGLALADLDGAPPQEILLSTEFRLLAYRGDGEFLWEIPVNSGGDPAAGQMDDDPQSELALFDGRVVDSLTLATEWQFSPYSLRGVEAGDLDGDGVDELLVTHGSSIEILDVRSHTVAATIQATLPNFGAMLVADVDGDGEPELVHADGDSVVIRNAETLAIQWRVEGYGGEPTSLALADVRGDGAPLLFWGAGADTTGPDRVIAADPRSGQRVFISHDAVGYVGPLLADVDGDGLEELIVASVGEGGTNNTSGLYVLDPESGAVRRFELLDWRIHDATSALAAYDLDGDGTSEIFVGGRHVYSGVLRAYRFLPGTGLETVWKADTSPDGITHATLVIDDFDADGQLEIAASSALLHSGGAPRVVFYDLRTGQELSEFATNFSSSRLLPMDRDQDGVAELLVTSPDCGRLDLFSAKSGDLLATRSGDFCAVSGSARELWAGDFNGRLWRLRVDAAGFVVEGSWQISLRPIDALLHSPEGVWLATSDAVHLFQNGAVQVSSPSLGYGRGASFLRRPSSSSAIWYAGRIAVAALALPQATDQPKGPNPRPAPHPANLER